MLTLWVEFLEQMTSTIIENLCEIASNILIKKLEIFTKTKVAQNLWTKFLNNSAVIYFLGHIHDKKAMQCTLQFNNVHRILNKKAPDFWISQEFD